MMGNEHVFDLLPGYALGSLDEEELIQVANHLPRCAICRAELDPYWAVVDTLAMAVPARTPPEHVKTTLLQRIQARSQPVQPAPGPLAYLRSFFARPLGLAFAALSVLLVLLAVSNWLLWRQFTELQQSEAQANMRVVDLHGSSAAPEADGYLMVFAGQTYGTLVVENAPPLQEGQQYQLWLVADGERESGGVFSVSRHGYGAVVVYADRPLGEYTAYGVTVEPEGGSLTPTGARILGNDY